MYNKRTRADLKIEVLTNPACSHCPAAIRATQELMESNPELSGRVKWKEIRANTSEGRKRTRKYQIRGVPTIILTNKNGQIGIIPGAPMEKKYLEAVYYMLGEEIPAEKKKQFRGFLSNFFGR